jgi:parallel beta-helix repeat protein
MTADQAVFGVFLSGRSGVTVKNLNIKDYDHGVYLFASDSNNLTNISAWNNYYGIGIYSSSDNTLSSNSMNSNLYDGISLYNVAGSILANNIANSNAYYGIAIDNSGSNTITNNTTDSNSRYGIFIGLYCIDNTITENMISNNGQYGLVIYLYSNNNQIYHNNFISNAQQAVFYGAPTNLFNKEYPIGGNYWSDYAGVDEKSGPNQDQLGSDNIGDTHYTFGNSQDDYPFMQKNGWQTPPISSNWSFAIISDLHIGQIKNPLTPQDYDGFGWNDSSGGEEHKASEYLRKIIDSINSKKNIYNIQFVAVTGDFTNSAEISELSKAKEILDSLEIPWIPLIGNHDIWPYTTSILIPTFAPEIDADSNGTDKFFNDIFNSQYEKLKAMEDFKNWEKEDYPVWNIETNPNHYSYFQNFSFNYKSYHFIGLDFDNRDNAVYWPWGVLPKGNLNNFLGGTWDWFQRNLNDYLGKNPGSRENIILFAHHPFRQWKEFEAPSTDIGMLAMGFSNDELGTIDNLLKQYKDNIWGEFAGHSHINKETSLADGAARVVETAANVDGPLARLVQFFPDKTISYSRLLGDGIVGTAHSPVDLEFIDPDGLIINKQLNQILGASYTEKDIDGDGNVEDQIEIPERKMGNYQVRVIPEPGAAPDDTYTLDVKTLENTFGYTPLLVAENVPISQIPSQPYSVEIKERTVTSLVYSGDVAGQYSNSVNLYSALTDKDGNPLAGKNINFQINEQTISALTDSNGIANALLVLNQIPSKDYAVEASFVGDQDFLPSSDSKDFEITKGGIVISVSDKEGYAFDDVVLQAETKDDGGQVPLPGFDVEFKIDNIAVGTSSIDNLGIATSSWQVDIIPKELTESYPIEVIFAGNDYYQPAQGHANFVLKSAKSLKQDVISDLYAAKTGKLINDLQIEAAKKLVQDSLSNNFWIDASHIIFFASNCSGSQIEADPDKIDPQKLFDAGNTNGINKNCSWIRSGLRVFGEEYLAIKLLQSKAVYKPIIGKLVKADYLLAKVAFYDVENKIVKNPANQKTVQNYITKAKLNLTTAEGIMNSQPDRAILMSAISWLRSQLAIKFASL